MASYRFYPAADQRQDEIWDYTLRRWGEKQAEKYIHGLHNHLQQLADKILQWRDLPNRILVPPDIDIKIYFSVYEYHYLFFRELSDGDIGIMSILHESMDLPTRLREDLELITRFNEYRS